MLATLTKTVTPKCIVGMSGNVGRSLGPLFMVVFTCTIQGYFMYYFKNVLR